MNEDDMCEIDDMIMALKGDIREIREILSSQINELKYALEVYHEDRNK